MGKTRREKIMEMLEMPKEVILDIPKLTVYNDNQLTVENYSGILEYGEQYIRLKTPDKTIIVSGNNLELRTITDVDVLIEGKVEKIEYE
ncbi:MAG: sporulation protein YqfC [Firmicutes bacterium]|nr:sporulation protein YqfC [Bacillota bacterium]